jgi:hypothetical protein
MPRTYSYLLLLVLAGAGLYCAVGTAADQPPARSVSDSELYVRVANRMRAGEPYYPSMSTEIAALGYPYAGSVFNWRLPTLSWLDAALPAPRGIPTVLTAVGLATVGLWFTFFLRQGVGRAIGAAVLLLAMFPLWMHDGTSRLHDLWAGQLIAASLASRACGFRRTSVVVGALALGIRELAAAYVVVVAALAFYERRRREAAAWGVVLLAFAVGVGFHAAAAAPEITGEAVAPNWLALGGWCFVLRAARGYVVLFATPTWVNALAVAVAVAGFTRWASPLGVRIGATVGAYLAAFMVAGLPVNWYWGFLIAPLLPLGALAWLPTTSTGGRSAS